MQVYGIIHGYEELSDGKDIILASLPSLSPLHIFNTLSFLEHT